MEVLHPEMEHSSGAVEWSKNSCALASMSDTRERRMSFIDTLSSKSTELGLSEFLRLTNFEGDLNGSNISGTTQFSCGEKKIE